MENLKLSLRRHNAHSKGFETLKLKNLLPTYLLNRKAITGRH